jgi:G:T-mismatch repair DNA endonuclease (very short patch repair protein)
MNKEEFKIYVKELVDSKSDNTSWMTSRSTIIKSIMSDLLTHSGFLCHDAKVSERIYVIINDITTSPTCECSKPRPFLSMTRGYQTFCSSKCSQSSSQVIEKVKSTCLSKYGKASYLGSESCKVKSKQSMLDKYGVEFSSQRDDWYDKVKKTSVDKFGVEHHSKSENFRLGRRDDNLIDYTKKLNDHLVEHNLTLMDEYTGVKDDRDDYIVYRLVCGVCNTSFDRVFGNGRFHICRTCNPKVKSGVEIEIYEFIRSVYSGVVLRNDRKILDGGRELDILLPEMGIAIEYHGLMWHSYGKDSWSRLDNYDLEHTSKHKERDKYEECKSKHISLIQIFEHEWKSKPEICKNIILSKLHINERIGARKTSVVDISHSNASKFLESYHIQGSGKFSKVIALEYNGEIVSVMTFTKSRYTNKHDWELHRICTKGGVTIIGGVSKLLKHFKEEYCTSGQTIVSYCDIRYSNGNVYNTIGMTHSHNSNPNYFYFKKNDLTHVYSRINFQKHKLSDKLELFDADLTERINMFNNGYRRIWDSGNMVFTMTV